MNITGYKSKHKAITQTLASELNKKKGDRSDDKIRTLETAKRDCMQRMREKQKILEEKRSSIPRRTIKGRGKRGRRKMFVKKKRGKK